MTSIKYLEKLKSSLETSGDGKVKVSILFGGDFNSDPPSKAYKYITSRNLPVDDVSEGN
jgi:endonuclease/exonuclease/phosphatase (EEP) superfamily protein YafD